MAQREPMTALLDDTTIGDAFLRAAVAYGPRRFLAVPIGAHRAYHRDGYEITFAEAAREVRDLVENYRSAGYGLGHRVALLLDNRPEYFLHKLALNTIGVSAVPINPDFPQTYTNLGDILLGDGRRCGCAKAFDEAVRVQPELAPAIRKLRQ